MEIIGIEKTTYENSLMEIERFLDRINNFANDYSSRKLNEWIDNQEVCLWLKISPRTLQHLRNTRQIPFAQMGRKIYYKKQDILTYLEKNNQKIKIMNNVITEKDERITALYRKLQNATQNIELIIQVSQVLK